MFEVQNTQTADLTRKLVVESGHDPREFVVYALIRHRIWSITDEMGATLRKMSGSASVSEANDFDFAICDEVGQEGQVGLYNTILVASARSPGGLRPQPTAQTECTMGNPRMRW